jgi:hypothetical protein
MATTKANTDNQIFTKTGIRIQQRTIIHMITNSIKNPYDNKLYQQSIFPYIKQQLTTHQLRNTY